MAYSRESGSEDLALVGVRDLKLAQEGAETACRPGGVEGREKGK